MLNQGKNMKKYLYAVLCNYSPKDNDDKGLKRKEMDCKYHLKGSNAHIQILGNKNYYSFSYSCTQKVQTIAS